MTNTPLRAAYCLLLGLVIALGIACNTTQTPEQQADDAAITTAVKSKLATDIDLSTVTNIEINTTNGVVTLVGQVSSEDLKRRAEEVTKQVEGVVRVTNNLQVEPAAG
jgi:hyperosmotically inducible protein